MHKQVLISYTFTTTLQPRATIGVGVVAEVAVVGALVNIARVVLQRVTGTYQITRGSNYPSEKAAEQQDPSDGQVIRRGRRQGVGGLNRLSGYRKHPCTASRRRRGR
jgi:hypothetical protein